MGVTRVVGHVGWWTFVVACLLVRSPSSGQPRRYADYLPVGDSGWTAYVPLTDAVAGMPPDGFAANNALTTVAMLAAVVTVVAAVTEAWLGRDWLTGALTCLTPVIGGFLVAAGADGGIGNHRLDWWVVLVLVLVGVAVREVWSRGLAPTRLAPGDRPG
nr:hypothetical protein [Gordonia araii]